MVQQTSRPLWQRLLLGAFSLLLATVIWVPCLHLLFAPDLAQYISAQGVPEKARAMAARHLELWQDPALRAGEINKMRARNAEWDFMGRTFLVLALSNMGLREPAHAADYLAVMDTIITETLRLEKEYGIYFFLMDYARHSNFASDPPRSLFVDGEIAIMLGARRLLAEKTEYQPQFAERVKAMVAYMNNSPVLSGESYPNECWMFCNSVALAAIRMSDVLDATDHSDFIAGWLRTARTKLTHQETGMLISSYTRDGMHLDGPEGSSIWMASHCLQTVDPRFASEQYQLARQRLAVTILGFGYAREWPAGHENAMDIDSGPIIPVLEASAGASGLAFLGATTFGDRQYLSELLTSLQFAGFPVRRDGKLQYAASNQVGDSVLLYALVQGPLWEKILPKSKEKN